ncbi:polyprenyl synthetase family protein [Paenibacillus sp. NPDC058174]|uniref:polyprenyl synthetase family protein n=1 Tax=Paenibacillus sp. NPDC058174 TaxID=3346366 RepID=UPI0036DD52AF
MEDFAPLIRQEMKQFAVRYFKDEKLLYYANLFMERKFTEPMKFGPLTVLHYRLFGGTSPEAACRAGASVELFILASDILDDLQDQDAPHQPWSQAPLPIALHLATVLMTLSQQAMTECGLDSGTVLPVIDMMNKQLLIAANGQMADLGNLAADEASYIDIVRNKSAALLVLACMTGVMLTGREWHAGVAEYAEQLGIAAQIENDRRDLLRWDEKNDFLQRKKTLLTLFLLEDLGEGDSWVADYYAGKFNESDVLGMQAEFEQLCERSGTMLYGSAMFSLYFNRFQELLGGIPETAGKIDEIMAIVSGKIANAGIPQ